MGSLPHLGIYRIFRAKTSSVGKMIMLWILKKTSSKVKWKSLAVDSSCKMMKDTKANSTAINRLNNDPPQIAQKRLSNAIR